MKKNASVIIFYLVVLGLIVFVAAQLIGGSDAKPCTYNEVEDFFENDLVKQFEVKNTYKMFIDVYVVNDETGELSRDEEGNITNKVQTINIADEITGNLVIRIINNDKVVTRPIVKF